MNHQPLLQEGAFLFLGILSDLTNLFMSYCKSNADEHMEYLVKAFQTYTLDYEDSPEVIDLKKRYLESAKQVVEEYLGFSLDLHEVEEEHIFVGSYEIPLKETPVQNVFNVMLEDGSYLPAPYYTLRGDRIKIHLDKKSELPHDYFVCRGDRILIEYSAGYNKLPDIIVQTILRIAALFKTEASGNIGITSKSYSDGSRSFVQFTNFDKFLSPLYPLRTTRLT